MLKHLIIIVLISWISHSNAQNFISDSLMNVYIESGVAKTNFIPDGSEKNGVKVGKWKDYTFEIIVTYKQSEDGIVDENLDHLLIQSVGKFVDGTKNGLWEFYAVEEGTFKKYHIADVTYRNGKRNGPIIYYYSSGEKAAEGMYENDMQQGIMTVYFKTGERNRVYGQKNDKIQGTLIFFYITGEKKKTINFDRGIRNGESTGYYTNGAIKSKQQFVHDTIQGTSTHYYPDGKIQEEGVYKNGLITSLKYYYSSGQLWVHREYFEGKEHNILELYDAQGKPLDFGTLKDGNGLVNYYTEDAKIYLKRTYSEGEIINEERFD